MMALNQAIRWSRLSRFGKSTLARLAIVTPFLGFLIFLNVELRDYVTLEPTEVEEGILAYLADRRIEFLYLGLVLIGASTAVFSLLAPDTIKASQEYSDYIQFKEDTKTQNAISGSLEASLENVSARFDVLHESFHDIAKRRDFPDHLSLSVFRLVTSIFEASSDGPAHEKQPDGSVTGMDQSYHMYNGYPDIDKILEGVTMRRRLEFAMWKSFYFSASDFSIDVFRLEYLIKDYSSPNLRLFVFLLFSVGAVVALIPTVVSVLLVLLISF